MGPGRRAARTRPGGGAAAAGAGVQGPRAAAHRRVEGGPAGRPADGRRRRAAGAVRGAEAVAEAVAETASYPPPALAARAARRPGPHRRGPGHAPGPRRGGAAALPPVDHPKLVGWYEGGASPGEEGTAIVVGHRDTRTGPAVFLDLHALKPGNTVRVERADGITAVFTVDRVRTYDKDEFPDREVYRQAERPELRLLTCGGTFDRRNGYTANTVVFAHLVDTVRTDARRA
ncbi:class F sortase [Streptomyces sudanensis]|uniref:class F sortase n=1 Tax=Streptomyces sudanensis TaxID=436397 RepID=UPI0027E3DD0C|nr:class F sortase [Streptomyces sudanensis]